MADTFVDLYEVMLQAAETAMGEMQVQMALEANRAIEEFEWEWNGPRADERNIMDTGNLMESLVPSDVSVEQNHIRFSMKWDAVDPETGKHYAELVHNGQEEYFYDEEKDVAYDYTARPWTFLLIPAEARDEGQVNTSTGPVPQSLPEDGWEAALEAFRGALRQQIAKRYKVVG